MKLMFTVKGEDYNEEITLHKAENGHFDLRTAQRFNCDGEEILMNLLGLLDTKAWHEAWMDADIKPTQEITIIDRVFGLTIPIIPDYECGTQFTVKTVMDNSEAHIRNQDYVFEYGLDGKFTQYTYENTYKKATQVKKRKHTCKPRIRACAYA